MTEPPTLEMIEKFVTEAEDRAKRHGEALGCDLKPGTGVQYARQLLDQVKACNDLLDKILLMIPGDDIDLVAELSAALGRGAKSCH
jgi:hypothetical protein